MQDLSLHVLDIVENALTAEATKIDIKVIEDIQNDLLELDISDNGKGMSEKERKAAADPFFTTKLKKRTGLGLPLLSQAAQSSGGVLTIESEPKKGTKIRITFSLSHPDRKPMGNMEKTIRILKAAHPEVRFHYQRIRRE